MPVVLADVGLVLRDLGIEARKQTGEWKARCPAHADRDPSWTVLDCVDDPQRHGLHKCWSCGFSGTLAALVMHVRGFASWGSAYRFLEERSAAAPLPASLRLEPPKPRPPFRLSPDVVVDPLDRWPGPARAYAESRGITAEQVERWGIGYAADGRLAGRLVFPIRNAWGVPQGYHSRLFAGDGPRYLCPKRETENPDLDVIFGEQHWPPLRERKARSVVVWEGAIKALAFERACPGRPLAVLGGGTELQPGHGLKLTSFGRVVVATDGDATGMTVASDFDVFRRHVDVRRVILPRDPDEMPPEEVARAFEGT